MAGFGKTPTTTTQGSLAANQFPASSVYPPNKGGSNPTDDFFVLEGGPITTDDDGNKSAPAGLYIKDGNDVTKGTQADVAWSGSGAATEIAILKKLVALLSAALTVSGTVTANAGTNMSTAALALETGGNLASAKTDLDSIVTSNSAINTATGAQADVAWVGSGNGSGIAILKKIVAELAATLTVSGSVSVSNLPSTQPVSGTFWQATQPVSNASLPLPTGAAQEAGHLATIDAHTPVLGQALMASSSPMVIASDQSKLPTKASSGDFVAGSIADIATLLTLSGTPADANTINSLMGRLTKIRDLLAATLTVSGAVTTSGTVTEANSASIKTDLDTIVTNTNKIPATPAQEGGNLATTVTRLTSILSQLQGILQIEQVDLSTTGTISAAQPVINTPVSNATVQLALAQGQSSWKAQLINGGGGFTSGTTLVADKSLDGGVTWFVANFKVGGSLTATTVQSIAGPGPLELTGNASAVTHIRIRCSVLNSTETIAVTLRGGTGIADIGLISSIPAGKNTVGNMSALAGYVALTSPPANTNAASDTALTFSSQANHFLIENNTSANIYVELDTAASTSSILLVPSATWRDDIQVTAIHAYTVAAQPVNAINGIVVKGWA